MAFDRIHEAVMAADRIIELVQSAGVDLTNPREFITMGWVGELPDGLMWNNGASRLVFWDEDYCDYVIKIALDEDFEKYCQHEVEVYEAAAKEGFADKFAWCTCYLEPTYATDGYIPGIYIMEYIDCDEEQVYDSAWMCGYKNYCEMKGLDSSNYDAADEYNDWNCDDEYLVYDLIIDSTDEEDRKALQVFLGRWMVTDLHSQNVGMVGSRPVIVDYAGWNW